MNSNLTHQREECTCNIGKIKDCPYCHQTTKDGRKTCCFSVACKDPGE